MKRQSILVLVMVVLFTTTFSKADLYDRGGGLIYDDVLNITWLQNANYPKTSGYHTTGLMNWSQAVAWAKWAVSLGCADAEHYKLLEFGG